MTRVPVLVRSCKRNSELRSEGEQISITDGRKGQGESVPGTATVCERLGNWRPWCGRTWRRAHSLGMLRRSL